MPSHLPQFGAPAPWFQARCTTNPKFNFDTVGGRYVVLCFCGSAADHFAATVLDGFRRGKSLAKSTLSQIFGVVGIDVFESILRCGMHHHAAEVDLLPWGRQLHSKAHPASIAGGC